MLRNAENLLYDCRIAIQVDSRIMGQHKCKSPTTALFIAFMQGRLSFDDYQMLLKRRCRVVAANGRDDRGGGQRATGKNKDT